MNKTLLLCECTDTELNFDGDTGAIGRMSIDKNDLTFDLKGRQYKGTLQKGPTILIINMAAPVGVKESDHVTTARVDYLTNEYCSLSFEKDLLSELKGVYTGSYNTAEDIDEMPTDKHERASAKTKRKNKGYDDDDDDEVEVQDHFDDDDDARKPKKKALKISTGRTQSMKGKDGKKKKGTKKKN